MIEFKHKKCFTELGKEVTFHRSNVDSDPNLAMKRLLLKLLENSYYGKIITAVKTQNFNIEREKGLVGKFNLWRFRSLKESKGGFYEVQSSKSKIEFNLPELLGFFVYQYTKLKMLEFYFGGSLSIYIMWDSFEMMEMDKFRIFYICVRSFE